GHHRRALDQQRTADDRRPARARRAGRVLDLRLNQLSERDPAVAGLARAVREGRPHDRRRAQPGILLGEAARQGGGGNRAPGRAVSRGPGQRYGDLEPLECARVADAGAGRQARSRPLPPHRRGRLCRDGGDDPPAAGGGIVTSRGRVIRLRYSHVTPEKLYLSRRELMAGAIALAAVGCDAGTEAGAAAPAPAGAPLKATPNPVYRVQDTPTKFEAASTYNNFYE